MEFQTMREEKLPAQKTKPGGKPRATTSILLWIRSERRQISSPNQVPSNKRYKEKTSYYRVTVSVPPSNKKTKELRTTNNNQTTPTRPFPSTTSDLQKKESSASRSQPQLEISRMALKGPQSRGQISSKKLKLFVFKGLPGYLHPNCGAAGGSRRPSGGPGRSLHVNAFSFFNVRRPCSR